MMTRTRISPLGARLIHMTAGPDVADAIIGDLEERMQTRSAPQRWFWQQVSMSLLSFVAIQIQAVSRRDWGLHILALCAACLAIIAWELNVARNYSWPIAKELIEISPLSVGNTCRACYVALYGTFVIGVMTAFAASTRLWKRGAACRIWQTLALGLIASAPAIFLLIKPLPTDGAVWFRLAQLGVVWAVTLFLMSRPRLRISPTI